jgi:lipid-binding SYLF domain-containing protein
MEKREFLFKSAAAVGAGALLLAGCTTTPFPPAKSPAERRQDIDASVTATLERMYTTVPGSRELASRAYGVLVFPSVIAAGFVVGGQVGDGALRVAGQTVDYYTTVTGSFGLQIGAQSKAIIFLFMTQEALDKFRNSSGWTAGVDASVAVLKVGVNGTLDTSPEPVNVIILTNQGLMAGLSVEGTKVTKMK